MSVSVFHEFLLLVVLSLLSLVLFSNSPSLFAKGDDVLIGRVCAKSSEPVMCSECLKNDPASHNADAKALLNITATCADADTYQLFHIIYYMVEKEKKGSPLEIMLDACVWEIGIAHKNWGQVFADIGGKQVGGAKDILIGFIIPLIDGCFKEWDKYPTVPVPGEILSGLSIVKSMSDVVLGVMDYILG